MKFSIYVFFALICLSCSRNNTIDENCKFLLNVGVNVPLNLNLPQYAQLEYPGNAVYVANAGNAGIIVANIGSGYLAWDASDPNHIPSACSALTINGLNGTCGCGDGNTYSLATGAPLNDGTLRCSLKFYRVEKNGNTLLVTN